MFRGSTYSIQTEKDLLNRSDLLEQQVRVALFGVSGVGKSSMLACIEQNEPFREDISNSKGIQIRFKKLHMSNYAVNLHVWDSPGGSMADYIEEGSLNYMDGIIEVFDLADKQSFHQLEQLHYLLRQHFAKIGKPLQALLAGNKTDTLSQPQLSPEQKQIDYLAEKFAKREDMLYLKVSAKHNSYVKDCFVQVLKQILVAKNRGKTSRIFTIEEEIGHSSHRINEATAPGCTCCCKPLSSCNIF